MPKRKGSKRSKASKVVVNVKTSRRKSSRRKVKKINVPAAQATRIPKPRFRRVSSKYNEQEIIIEGEDLVIPTPDALPTSSAGTPIFLSVPANPLYWKGTRVSGIAAVYQQYRPLKFEVDYIPQVPVTVPGQVIYGTLYNKGVDSGTFQQTLMTSNGGGMTQCYLKSTSRVICNKKTLPLTLYNTFDPMNENVANPFTWVAHYSGAWNGSGSVPTTNQPGWVYVRWKYMFSVGLGNTGKQVDVINQTDSSMSMLTNAFAGWGVVISWLKNKAVTLLSKIAIVLLDETAATASAASTSLKTTLGIGSTYTVDPASLNGASNDGGVTLHDDAGNTYVIPDSTRVVVYQNGEVYVKQTDEGQAGDLSVRVYATAAGSAFNSDATFVPVPKLVVTKNPNNVVVSDATDMGFSVRITYEHFETYLEQNLVTSINIDYTGKDTNAFYYIILSTSEANIYSFWFPFAKMPAGKSGTFEIWKTEDDDKDMATLDCSRMLNTLEPYDDTYGVGNVFGPTFP